MEEYIKGSSYITTPANFQVSEERAEYLMDKMGKELHEQPSQLNVPEAFVATVNQEEDILPNERDLLLFMAGTWAGALAVQMKETSNNI